MLHYLIELAILLLVAYALGALLGALLRKTFGADTGTSSAFARSEVVATPAAEPVAVPLMAAPPAPVAEAPAPESAEEATPLEAVPEPEPVPLAAVGKMDRPKGIAAARGGKADKLQRISGVGPKNEKILHGLGIFHFDQIAAWSREQIAWVDDHLKFNGRIVREEWMKQARLLAEGKEDEFTKLYGTGGMKNTEGEKVSGSRTRRS